MTSVPQEIYRPRAFSNRGVWDLGAVTFKAYDLRAKGKSVTPEMIATADTFLRKEVLPAVAHMGENNGLGFVIIHPGDLGLTIAAHWWAQESVLCQRIYRRLYDSPAPLDTVNRPAVACVWELEIITAEHQIWRETMMTPPPDTDAYVNTRAEQATSVSSRMVC